jgi:hypothetical protein
MARPAARPRPRSPARHPAERRSPRGQAELTYLRTFSDVYRMHLHGYLDALVRNVEERAENASLADVGAELPRLPHYPQRPAPTG